MVLYSMCYVIASNVIVICEFYYRLRCATSLSTFFWKN